MTLSLQARYQAIKPIGQGGFGRTFLAIDASQVDKSRCVIKQFYPQQQGTDTLEKASELFQQEAQRLQELGNHCQIPTLISYLEQDGYQYLVQEWIDGCTLEQELANGKTFGEQDIRQLLEALLPVVQFIHDHHVIHRDIKPANIIRRASDHQLFLVDLGAAKQAMGTAFAKTGTVIGSAEYTAPEQSRGKATFASDLYSLGVTCMYLLTELSPFDLFDGGNGRWVWQDYLRQPVGLSLRWILNKMVQQATNRRYQSANQVLTDLSQPENVLMDDRTSQSSSIQDHSVSPNQTHASLNVSHEQGGQITPTSADTRRLQKKKEFLRNNFATRPLSLLEGLALGVVGLIAMPVASALVIILLRGAFGAFSFTLLIPWLLIGIVILLYFEGPP
jgi:serine/threonine protein kinase